MEIQNSESSISAWEFSFHQFLLANWLTMLSQPPHLLISSCCPPTIQPDGLLSVWFLQILLTSYTILHNEFVPLVSKKMLGMVMKLLQTESKGGQKETVVYGGSIMLVGGIGSSGKNWGGEMRKAQ